MARKKPGPKKGNRTRKGTVTAKARKKHGTKKGSNKRGSFPVFDKKSAKSALKLRGHAKSKKAVVDKVARYANKTGDAELKAKVKKARQTDRKKS